MEDKLKGLVFIKFWIQAFLDNRVEIKNFKNKMEDKHKNYPF